MTANMVVGFKPFDTAYSFFIGESPWQSTHRFGC